MLLSTAPVESRIARIVDLPNTCVTVSVPQEIFEFDIDPDRLADGGPDERRGEVAKTS